jgi:hypothetical protein
MLSSTSHFLIRFSGKLSSGPAFEVIIHLFINIIQLPSTISLNLSQGLNSLKSTTIVTLILVFGCIALGIVASVCVIALSRVRARFGLCQRSVGNVQSSNRPSDDDQQQELASLSNASETAGIL